MPAVTEISSLGLSVEIRKIDHELKKLWQESEGAMTRASLMNLAVYSEKRRRYDARFAYESCGL